MKTAVIISIILFMLTGCSGDKDMDNYHKLVKKELAVGKRVDSIFFGIHFGMGQQAFFTHCWQMNKKGIFSDGTGNTGVMYVLYKLDKELKHPASMNFFPDFNDSTIWKMRVNIKYDGWVPWNKSLGADSLLPAVLTLFKKWYSDGNSFIRVNDEQRGTVYVKVDGNRRITIRKQDDAHVNIDFIDMLVEKQIKNKDEH